MISGCCCCNNVDSLKVRIQMQTEIGCNNHLTDQNLKFGGNPQVRLNLEQGSHTGLRPPQHKENVLSSSFT